MSCYPIHHLERPLKAIILCGGLSTRMGTDKGLMLDASGITWAKRVQKLCSTLALDTTISINKTQLTDYSSIFKEEELVIDLHQNIGPIGGILSAYNAHPDHDLLVLSCDMLDVDKELLLYIINSVYCLGEFDAVAIHANGFYQPFPGLYSNELLRKISILHETNQLESYSLQYIFKSFYIKELNPSEALQAKLKSYNSI